MRIAIFNGPNLNMLGRREPALYGTRSMEQIMVSLQKAWPNVWFMYRQSNHEGDIIDWLQEADTDAIILNAGGYTHTSVAIRDAISCIQVPVYEVHLTNIYEREDFRRRSLLTDVCRKTFIGNDCYEQAVEHIMAARP